MKNFNKLFIFLILTFVFQNNTQSYSLIPLKKYCKENNIKEDNAALGYVLLRCSSLFACSHMIMKRRIEKNSDNIDVSLKNTSNIYLKLSIDLSVLSCKALKENAENVMSIQKK